ncbi:MAG TPA: hypothetical protein PLA18_05540 [Deltaproteobacteria bacterium]|jgi:hypothetical protein|nr:hypothetical protein [Deltaproteobacteria bacterium]
MENTEIKENELDYLKMVVSIYADREEDEMIALFLARINQSLERMKACA